MRNSLCPVCHLAARPAFPDSPVKETTQLADGRVDENLNAPHTTTQYSEYRRSSSWLRETTAPRVQLSVPESLIMLTG